MISGRKLARQIRQEARHEVEQWVAAGNKRPHLSVVLVGENPASHSYVLNKTKAAADVGMFLRSFNVGLPTSRLVLELHHFQLCSPGDLYQSRATCVHFCPLLGFSPPGLEGGAPPESKL